MNDRKGIIALFIVLLAFALCCWGVIRYLLGLLPGWLAIVFVVICLAMLIARRISSSRPG